jgi:hypothetical protein
MAGIIYLKVNGKEIQWLSDHTIYIHLNNENKLILGQLVYKHFMLYMHKGYVMQIGLNEVHKHTNSQKSV